MRFAFGVKRAGPIADQWGVNTPFPISPLGYAAFAQLMRELPAAWREVRRALGFVDRTEPSVEPTTGPEAEAGPTPLRIEPADRPARRAA